MIYLGVPHQEKASIVNTYCQKHDIKKLVVFSPEKFVWSPVAAEEVVKYSEIILYKFFYRLLQEIDKKTLVVVNECLRTQNRNDLTYNCLRHYLYQAGHQIIFQYLPVIDTIQDFLILVDFDTKSQWKRDPREHIITHATVDVREVPVAFTAVMVPTPERLKRVYQKKKENLFTQIGSKDPHTLPRQLHLVAGKEKLSYILQSQEDLFRTRQPNGWYVGRNNRFKVETLQTYREKEFPQIPYTVFEFCHNFIDFSDFISLSQQHHFDVLVADLRVEHWYFNRHEEWGERIRDVYSAIRQYQNRA